MSGDVVVVGAGPAGAATAIVCAEAGMRVAILERRVFPRERPGETLHPGIESPLRELGVFRAVSKAGFLRHEGIWVQWDSPLQLVRYGSDAAGPWLGFQAWRAQLDGLLLERAVELGADYHESCRALDPLVAGGRVVGVETSTGARQADFVVDAAGPQHWLARRLGLDLRYRSPRLKARFGYAQGLSVVRDETPALVADEVGWTWTAKVREGLYHWTRLNLDGSLPHSEFRPEEFDGLKQRGPSRSSDVSWRAVKDAAGPGYLAVGDAAAVLDPAASHGVLKALLTGTLAGRLITDVLVAGADPEAAARLYRNSVNTWFLRDLSALRDLYGRLRNAPRWLYRLRDRQARTATSI